MQAFPQQRNHTVTVRLANNVTPIERRTQTLFGFLPERPIVIASEDRKQEAIFPAKAIRANRRQVLFHKPTSLESRISGSATA